MDRRFNPEIISPMYGFYSITADPSIQLTEDCGDLAILLGYSAEEIAGKALSDIISDTDNAETVAELKYQLNCFGEVELLNLMKSGSFIN